MFYSPIFGICFQLPIICAEERIHITKSKGPDSTGDLLDLDSDAEHQSEKSEHPVQLKSTGIRFLQEKTRRKQLFGVSGRRQNKKDQKYYHKRRAMRAVTERSSEERAIFSFFHALMN